MMEPDIEADDIDVEAESDTNRTGAGERDE